MAPTSTIARSPARLPVGLILEVLASAGVAVPDRGAKRSIKCPFHEDRQSSAVVFVEENVLHCSSCARSWTAKQCADALGVPWGRRVLPGDAARPAPRPARNGDSPAFTARDAEALWAAAVAEIHDEKRVEANENRLAFVRLRGVSAALDCGEDLVGFLPWTPTHDSIRSWYQRPSRPWGYEILAPLFDETGTIQNIQARATVAPVPEGAPKILFPKGSRAAGARFANRAGRALLAGAGGTSCTVVLLGEGMFDFVSLACARPAVPVLGAPGTGLMERVAGSWCRGRTVYVGVHADEAGERAGLETARKIAALGGRPRRLRWPAGAKDANDAVRAIGIDEFSRVMEEVAK